MRAPWWVLIGCCVLACVKPESVECGDVACPYDTTCRQLTAPEAIVCATPEQLTACEGVAERGSCTVASGLASTCHNGVCLSNLCGNVRIDFDELCDDGNLDAGDGCSATCESDERCGNGIVDPINNEQCDDGDLTSADGCSSDCRIESLLWEPVSAAPPTGREGPALAYDSLRRRIVMFGGRDDNGVRRDTFEWDGIAWYQVSTIASPSARMRSSIAYDAERRVIVLFGGQTAPDDKSALNDLWTWDGQNWRPVFPATSPSVRTMAGMAYDSRRKKVVLFGGSSEVGTSDELWEWDGTNWVNIPKSGSWPGARHGAVMVYDPNRARIVLAGGRTTDQQSRRDTWEFDGTSWHLSPAIPPAELDYKASAAIDPLTGNVLAYGGESGIIASKTFVYTGTAWTDKNQSGPGQRSTAGLATDPLNGTAVLFGGIGDDSGALAPMETWLWNGSTWQSAALPPYRTGVEGPAFARDPLRGFAWTFGGRHDLSGNGTDSDELWRFDGKRWLQEPAFGPAARRQAAMAFDEARGELVLFGGAYESAPFETSLRPNETWVFDTSWHLRNPSTKPAPRDFPAMAYDPVRKRVVMVGGVGEGNDFFNETWEWDGTNWQLMAPATKPAARGGASLVYDYARQRLILTGGLLLDTTAMTLTAPPESWAWDGTNWTLLSPTGLSPGRAGSTLVYQPLCERSVLYGGLSFGGALDDLWAFDGQQTWSPLLLPAVPGPRFSGASFLDREGDDVLIFGGSYGNGLDLYSDTLRLRYVNTSPRELCEASVDNDNDGLSGCADPDCWSVCTPTCPPGFAACPADAPRCGDGTCSSLENCRMCSQDCTCTPVCGDNVCDPGETATSCPGDC